MEDNPGTRVDTVYTNNNQIGTYNLTNPYSYTEGSGGKPTFLSGTSPITSGQTVSDFWQNALNRPYGERKHGGESHLPSYQTRGETQNIIEVASKNDPRYIAYKDSSDAYNLSVKRREIFEDKEYDGTNYGLQDLGNILSFNMFNNIKEEKAAKHKAYNEAYNAIYPDYPEPGRWNKKDNPRGWRTPNKPDRGSRYPHTNYGPDEDGWIDHGMGFMYKKPDTKVVINPNMKEPEKKEMVKTITDIEPTKKNPTPKYSIVDLLDLNKQDSSKEARTKLYAEYFPEANKKKKYTGTKEENIRMIERYNNPPIIEDYQGPIEEEPEDYGKTIGGRRVEYKYNLSPTQYKEFEKSNMTIEEWVNRPNKTFASNKRKAWKTGGENYLPSYQVGSEVGWEETPDFDTWKAEKMKGAGGTDVGKDWWRDRSAQYNLMSNHDLYEAYKKEYPDKINFIEPQVTKKKKNFFDSPGMKAYGAISEGLVAGAGVLNEMALKEKQKEAENYLRTMGMADNAFGYYEDTVGTRGYWDENTGILQPDQQTPYSVQSGGETQEFEVDDKMIQKLIAAGADIEYL